MLRRMVPSHPQADARKLARTAQQSRQQSQPPGMSHDQQPQASQQLLADHQQPLGNQVAPADGTAAPALPASQSIADLGTAGGAMALQVDELLLDDKESVPSSAATAFHTAPGQSQVQPSAAVTGVDKAQHTSAFEPGDAHVASDLPAAEAALAAAPLPAAAARHRPGARDSAAVAREGTSEAAQQNGGCPEADQQPQPSPSRRGDLPELAEELAETAMQVRMSQARALNAVFCQGQEAVPVQGFMASVLHRSPQTYTQRWQSCTCLACTLESA